MLLILIRINFFLFTENLLLFTEIMQGVMFRELLFQGSGLCLIFIEVHEPYGTLPQVKTIERTVREYLVIYGMICLYSFNVLCFLDCRVSFSSNNSVV